MIEKLDCRKINGKIYYLDNIIFSDKKTLAISEIKPTGTKVIKLQCNTLLDDKDFKKEWFKFIRSKSKEYK